MKKYDIMFILPMPTRKIVGGYKMIYEYANFISENGYKVCIVYNGFHGENSKNFPKTMVYVIRKVLGLIGPSWFELNRNIDRKVIPEFCEKYLPYAKKIVASTAESAIFVNNVLKKAEQKFYFIQDFEDWEISVEELYKTYAFDMIKITVAKWLKTEIDRESMQKAIYIPNGINSNVFKVIRQVEKRQLHSVAMLYHSDKRKGCVIGLEVVNRLKTIYPDLVVNMFGSPEKRNNWGDWIKYTQNASQEEVSDLLNKSTVFLCTSRSEGYGLTGLESLFCGCILVTTNCKGVMEYASDKNSIICEVDNVDELVRGVSKVFDNREERVVLQSMNKKIIKEFDINVSKKKFEEVVMN